MTMTTTSGSVGFPVTRVQTDQTIGQLSRSIEQWHGQATQFSAWLDSMPDEDLQRMPFNYSADDVALLKSAARDLALLGALYTGQEALPQARDLGVFARRTAGLFLTT
jgi:hypothetical protein